MSDRQTSTPKHFRAALPHQLDGLKPRKRDLPVYIERVDELEAEIRTLADVIDQAFAHLDVDERDEAMTILSFRQPHENFDYRELDARQPARAAGKDDAGGGASQDLGRRQAAGCPHGFPDPHGETSNLALGPCPTCMRDERDRYRAALHEIAYQDYRGNRPWSAVRAYQALYADEIREWAAKSARVTDTPNLAGEGIASERRSSESRGAKRSYSHADAPSLAETRPPTDRDWP